MGNCEGMWLPGGCSSMVIALRQVNKIAKQNARAMAMDQMNMPYVVK